MPSKIEWTQGRWFLSCEPLLEDLGALDFTNLDWVIVGGESGPGARPCDIAWIRSIVQQCCNANVPCFVKQLGAKPVANVWGVAVFEKGTAPQSGRKEFFRTERLWSIRDPKGGDPFEWPEDLRVREMPAVLDGLKEAHENLHRFDD